MCAHMVVTHLILLEATWIASRYKDKVLDKKVKYALA